MGIPEPGTSDERLTHPTRKLLCAVIQLSQNVDSWLSELDKDYKNFVNKRILIKADDHLKHEIMWPYNIDFYTRKLPFTRGDD